MKLVRFYHPDRNPSISAAAKVREITAAYAVLSVPERRARYDAQQSVLRRPQPAPSAPGRPSLRLPSWFGVAVASVVVLLFVPLLIPPVVPRQASEESSGADAPSTATPQKQFVQAAASSTGAPCTALRATQEVENELFRRASKLAGGETSETFARLAGSLRLRFGEPVRTFARRNAIDCEATVALEYQAGVSENVSQPGLTSKIRYTLHRPNDGAVETISLGGGEQLARILATVGRTTTQTARAFVPVAADREPVLRAPMVQEPPVYASAVAPPVRAKRPVEPIEPSFSCKSARNWAMASVCNSATLANLDRQLATLWGDSMARASESDRARLLASDGRFIVRRDACSSEACVQAAYTAQIGQIRSALAVQRQQ